MVQIPENQLQIAVQEQEPIRPVGAPSNVGDGQIECFSSRYQDAIERAGP